MNSIRTPRTWRECTHQLCSNLPYEETLQDDLSCPYQPEGQRRSLTRPRQVSISRSSARPRRPVRT